MRGAGHAVTGGLQVRSKLVEKTLEAEVSKSHRFRSLQLGANPRIGVPNPANRGPKSPAQDTGYIGYRIVVQSTTILYPIYPWVHDTGYSQ